MTMKMKNKRMPSMQLPKRRTCSLIDWSLEKPFPEAPLPTTTDCWLVVGCVESGALKEKKK